MSIPVRIFKIDPAKRLIAPMSLKPSLRLVRQLIGFPKVGWRILLPEAGDSGEQLIVASRADVNPNLPIPEWRFRGMGNTVGTGILFGSFRQNVGGEGMWNCPVDREWIEREIVWCEPGEVAPAAEVAKMLGLEPSGTEIGDEPSAS